MIHRAWRNVLGSARLVVELLLIVAVCEVVVMFLLPSLAPGLTAWQDALLDALVLSVMAAPLLTWRAHRMVSRAASARVLAAPSQAAVRMLPWLVFVLGIGLSMWLAWGLHRQAQHAAYARFEQVADSLKGTVQGRFDRAADGLRDIASASALMGHVLDRQALSTWVKTRNLGREYPGLLALSLIKPIPRAALPDYEARMQALGFPGFKVRTAGQAPVLYLIDAIEPLGPNRQALGFDVSSEPARQEALQRAIDTGEATLSAQVHLVQLGHPRPAFLYFLPLYKPGWPVATVAQRRAALEALVSAPILLEGMLDGLDPSLLYQAQYALYDVSGGRAAVLLASSTPHDQADKRAPAPQFASNHAVSVGGRTLALHHGFRHRQRLRHGGVAGAAGRAAQRHGCGVCLADEHGPGVGQADGPVHDGRPAGGTGAAAGTQPADVGDLFLVARCLCLV